MTHRPLSRPLAVAAVALACGTGALLGVPVASAQAGPTTAGPTTTAPAPTANNGVSTHVPGHIEGYWTRLRMCLAIPAPMPGVGGPGVDDLPRIAVGSIYNLGVLGSVEGSLESVFCSGMS